MSANSGIEWTDRTWNPLTGCTKVSPGCDHCYAKSMHERFNGPGAFDTITLHPDRLDQPLRWRKPSMVFVNSMSDLFHQDVPDEYIARVFAVMATAYPHTFQVLTKRHARMRSLLTSDRFIELFDHEYCRIPDWADRWPDPEFSPGRDHLASGPLRNVWLGVSVENQQWADTRIPALLNTPAAVRFLSCEPLVGPVDLRLVGVAPSLLLDGEVCRWHRAIDWVIVGGESGRGARPMHPDWARSLRDQCVAAGVPFLFKQWGAWRLTADLPPELAEHGAETLAHGDYFTRVGKKAAGRVLDGRTWDEYPAGAAREAVQA